jgi:hemerythrin superfamily protein
MSSVPARNNLRIGLILPAVTPFPRGDRARADHGRLAAALRGTAIATGKRIDLVGTKGADMNAIDLLEAQHREVEDLFTEVERSKDAARKEQAFVRLADILAIHTSIEEHHFYPAVKEKRSEDLGDALQDHLTIKRALNDLLDADVEDEAFDLKLETLKDEVEHHVEEEESELFPLVMRAFDEGELEDLGDAMAAEQAELEERGNPREVVPEELERVSPV